MGRIIATAWVNDKLNKAIDHLVLGAGIVLFATALLGSLGLFGAPTANAAAVIDTPMALTTDA